MKQTILGAGGAISEGLIKEILNSKHSLRLVSRSAKPVAGTESVSADLLDAQAIADAVKDSDIVYLLAGLKYDTKVWQSDWHRVMQNTIEACKKHDAKLIFFDNVYAYGKVEGKMTEETPFNPCSKKGEVRARIADMLMNEVKKGNLTAAIARAADFYGPNTPLSMTTAMVFENLANGKAAQWFCDLNKKHSFTYTPDCGKALFAIANDDKAFNQTWHMPTQNPAPTGREFIEIAALAMGAKPKTQIVGSFMNRILGLFIPVLKEFQEMLYQFDSPYYFDSTKFEQYFKIKPTPYEEGIKTTAAFYKKKA
jgi:nucleoside-diphosphate-sugar epimerase